MLFKFKRKTADKTRAGEHGFDAVYDASSHPPASAWTAQAPQENHLPQGKGKDNAGSLHALGLGLAVLVLMALCLGAVWYHGRQTSRLLDGIGQIRAAVRASYNSQQGYGLVAGAALKPAQWRNQLPEGWSLEGGTPQHNLGSPARLRSQVSTFDLRVEGVWPLSCMQILPLLDKGWAQVRYDGHALSLPVSDAEARQACGYFHSGTLEMVSTG